MQFLYYPLQFCWHKLFKNLQCGLTKHEGYFLGIDNVMHVIQKTSE